MNQEELLRKVEHIETQARDALAEFPALARERLQMILALARFVRTELIRSRVAANLASGYRSESLNDEPARSSGSQ